VDKYDTVCADLYTFCGTIPDENLLQFSQDFHFFTDKPPIDPFLQFSCLKSLRQL